MRLGREVDDDVDLVLGERALRELEVGDVALDERHVFGHVLADARVREQVVADDVIVWMTFAPVAHEVRADEPGRAGDEQTHERESSELLALALPSMQCFASLERLVHFLPVGLERLRALEVCLPFRAAAELHERVAEVVVRVALGGIRGAGARSAGTACCSSGSASE